MTSQNGAMASPFRAEPRVLTVLHGASVLLQPPLFSLSVVSSSLQHHQLQYARLPCPSPSPGACSNSCPLSWWCHPTISSSVVPFSSCPQSFLASGSFPISWLFTSPIHTLISLLHPLFFSLCSGCSSLLAVPFFLLFLPSSDTSGHTLWTLSLQPPSTLLSSW